MREIEKKEVEAYLKKRYPIISEYPVYIGDGVKPDHYSIDICLELDTRIIAIEVDENQHDMYDQQKEIVRMRRIGSTLNKPTLFIRYNPNSLLPSQAQGAKRLKKMIDRYSQREVSHPLSCIHMFYTGSRVVEISPLISEHNRKYPQLPELHLLDPDYELEGVTQGKSEIELYKLGQEVDKLFQQRKQKLEQRRARLKDRIKELEGELSVIDAEQEEVSLVLELLNDKRDSFLRRLSKRLSSLKE